MIKITCAFLVMGISGCATTAQREESPEISRPGSATTSVPGVATDASAESENPISIRLRKQAVAAMDNEDYAQAIRLLERALRAAPRSAANYYQFARIRLKQSQPTNAIQLIDKGLSLRPEPELLRQMTTLKQEATALADPA